MKEVWRDVVGYEGLYQVSSIGRIKSLHHGKEKIRKLSMGRHYLMIGLTKDGKNRMFTVHRLVAKAFLGDLGSGFTLVVNHKDVNKLNNNVENLEWCTMRENRHHADLHGVTVRGEKHGRAKLTPQDVEYIRRTYVKRKHGYLHMSKEFNVNKTTIKDIIIGKNWRHTANQTTI